MKRSTATWAISAIVYLGIIIIGYSVYANMNPKTEVTDDHNSKKSDQHNSKNEHTDHEESDMSEVIPKVAYANGITTVELKDKNNNAPELEVSHEKLMHLIVVSSDLEEYHHFHPEEANEGIYQNKFDLVDNSYKAFVDIKPKGLSYSVQPIEFHVGKIHQKNNGNNLVVDKNFTKTINNQPVELKTTEFDVNKEITLDFDLKSAKPEPYLGALGHVVILDENAENFIHVHPVSDDQTVFKTEFTKPGVYKMWAEFKFGEQVNAYPFVIEVK
ncbi:hypothetical protein ABE042_18520 [Viridibacillus arvi]|uniref:hypothetical protein n=1 Tax=Viridibacillus arvi TaxID=263475 RepID=UPI003D041FC6